MRFRRRAAFDSRVLRLGPLTTLRGSENQRTTVPAWVSEKMPTFWVAATDDYAMRLRRLLAAVFLLAVSACSPTEEEGVTLASLRSESILDAAIPGLSAKRITEEQSGTRPKLTQLMDVTGSWETASVKIAEAVQIHGWTVESINCVGTGNDVIAKKLSEGQWMLLESGAGSRAAGIILSLDPGQRAPSPLTVDGRCPQALINAVS